MDSFDYRFTVPAEDRRYFAGLADQFYERLKKSIEETESELDEGEILLIYYYSQGGEPILVENIGYHNTNLIRLYGVDEDDNECTVLVHMQSLQLVMKVVKERDLEAEDVRRRPIGFTGEATPGSASSSSESST